MLGIDEFSIPPPFLSLQRLRGYWQGLLDETGRIPEPADLDPRGLAPILSEFFMGERIGRGLVQLQVAGQSLTEVSGHDLQGLPLSILFTAEARLRLAETVERLFDEALTAEMELEAERSMLRPAISARLLLLPLRSARSGREMLVGCLASKGILGQAPRRFAIAHVTTDPITLPQDQLGSLRPLAKVPLFHRLPEPPVTAAITSAVGFSEGASAEAAASGAPLGKGQTERPRFSVFYPDQALAPKKDASAREADLRQTEGRPSHLRLVYTAEA